MIARPTRRFHPLLRGPIRPGREHAGFQLLQVRDPDPRRRLVVRGGRVAWGPKGLLAAPASPRIPFKIALLRDPSPKSRLLLRAGRVHFVGRAGVDIFTYLPGEVFSPNLAATVHSSRLPGTVNSPALEGAVKGV